MSDPKDQALEQAFERIESGFPDEAAAILKPLLEADPDDVDAWWLYAHAVREPNEARRALNNVLRLDPDYDGAAAMAATLDEKFPAPRIRRLDAAPPPESMPEAPASIPEPAAPAPVVSAAAAARAERVAAATAREPERTPTPSARRAAFPILPVVIAAVILIALFIILNGGGGGGEATATPTSIAQGALTATPGIGDMVEATPEATTAIDVATEEPAATDVIDERTPDSTAAVDTATDEPAATDVVSGVGEPTAEATPIIDATAATMDMTAEVTVELGDVTPEATPATEIPSEITPTSDAALVEVTPEVTSDAGAAGESADFSMLDGVLARYTLPENGIEVVQTALGNTLQISVCSIRGPEMRARVQEVLTLISRESPSLPADIDGIAARMTNCDDGSTLQILGVPRATADAFANRTINAASFEAQWQPL
jgi:hypothetical protein